ncbi:MAG TPA: hypothetical protein VF035_05370 [Longimicrobiales bacterium]
MKKSCNCRAPGHDLWCPRLVDDVNTSTPVPTDEIEENAIQAAIRDTVEKAIERHGHEEVRTAFLRICLRHEARLRARFGPEHSVIQLLDDYHRDDRQT